MPGSNQDGYYTLGWIINKSEQGLFIVVAYEMVQKEIVGIYTGWGKIGSASCRERVCEYV